MRDTVYENAEQGVMTNCNYAFEYITELQQYLVGLTTDMPQAFFHLAEILKAGAFELCKSKKTGDYLIPYMMNDAVEYCLPLIQGEQNIRIKNGIPQHYVLHEALPNPKKQQ